jgi:hypothetical protein
MKKILIIALTITTVNGMAQQIVPLFGDADIYISNSGHYYKDVDNDFDKFVGTWKWIDNSNSWTVVLKKILQIDDGDGYTYDALYGEYQYIENGIEKVNTLANINDTNIHPLSHKISNPLIIANHHLPQCLDCEVNEHRISITIEHPNFSQITGELIMRYRNEGGVEKIYLNILDGQGKFTLNVGDPTNIDIPLGDYVLIKQ